MPRYQDTRRTLGKHKLAPKKRFGQNFLVHERTAEAIADAGQIAPADTIIEVGVGLGALTAPIARRAARVIGLEIDRGIIRMHEEEGDLPENVTLRHVDVLKADFQELYDLTKRPLRIMANLPYSISNPFVFKLIDNREWLADATIMLQKEVAERLMARPGTKEYGAPSVLLQYCATLKRLMVLKPAEFHPRPKVDSLVVRIDFQSMRDAVASDFDFACFQRVVRTAFNQRRKTLANSLGNTPVIPRGMEAKEAKELLLAAFRETAVNPRSRPEELSVDTFANLSQTIGKLLDQAVDREARQ